MGLALACGVWIGCCGAALSSAAEIDLIVEALGLEPGARVADVGAGDGSWAVRLARYVGPEGHVWATEVDEDEIEEIEKRVIDEDLLNVTIVSGSQRETGLPAACCDAILLRMVYHHFSQPVPMRRSLRQALRPGGLIAVIDIVPQSSWRRLPGVPDRGGHGIPPDDLVAEMIGDGFEVVSRQDDWNGDRERYCMVFRRSAGGS